MDIEKAIRSAVDSGKVIFGEKQTIKATRAGEIKLAIVADDCPAPQRTSLEDTSKVSDVDVYDFQGSAMDLGSVCGKPFIVSMMGILEAGDSDILEVGRR